MNPENPNDQPSPQPASSPYPPLQQPIQPATTPATAPAETRFLMWTLFGPDGLRAGWSIAIFFISMLLLLVGLGVAATPIAKNVLHISANQFTPVSALFEEIIQVLAIAGGVTICALVERRSILSYNLAGPRRSFHFITGMTAGFAALSMLVGVMYWGNWIHFGGIALSGVTIFRFGALWGVVFILTGFAEEGSVRCYLQYTLTRGLNFWWALGLVSAMCACGLMQKGDGIWGVYISAVIGVLPCAVLHFSRPQTSGFWQATWVTSTFFGFIHTGNSGENWIGIFAAAAIGFVFCVSIRLTGSAWWAIGFHASWDWAQTFFYGTADSGFLPEGHFLTTTPAGSKLWSGGTDGPEGSLLVIPVILIVLLALVMIHGRRSRVESPSTAAQPQLS